MIDVFALLIGGLAYDEKGRMLNLAPKTSLLASLFFAVHPIHTESVSKVQIEKKLISVLHSRFFQCFTFSVGLNKTSDIFQRRVPLTL